MHNWRLPEVNKAAVKRLVKKFQLTSITAQTLVNRGFTKVKEVEAFLNPSLNQLQPPTKLNGAQEAAALISTKIKKKQKICVFGDFDVDGLTATALLVRVLKKLGAAVWPVIPNRFLHGYGLHQELIKKIADHGFALVVAVDCGVANINEVRLAKKLGLKVIVVDHHQPSEQLPEADVIVNPKQVNCQYPFKELAGVGLAYKLAQLVAANFNQEELVTQELDLVALGTVCDLVPLVGENRILTYYGLKQLNKRERVGLAQLCQVAGLANQEITTEHLGYILGPRINAAGRLSTAHDCLHLLLTTDKNKALQLALKINRQNQERSQLEEKMLADALKQVDVQKRALVVAAEDWHEGIKGIVASRLVDYFHRPAIVFTIKDKLALGSGRSIPGFNLYTALKKCQRLLVKWGGHQMAAGLTVEVSKLELFKKEFARIAADQLADVDLKPTVKIDAVANLNELSFALLAELEKLAPFGFGNPVPKLLIPNVFFDNQTLTANGKHAKLLVTGDGPPLAAVMFRPLEPEAVVKEMRAVDIVAYLGLDTFNSQKKLLLKLVDFKTAVADGFTKVKVKEDSKKDGKTTPVFIDWRQDVNVKEKVIELLKHRGAAVYLRDELSAVHFCQRLQEKGVPLEHSFTVTGTESLKLSFKRLIFYHPPLNQQVFTALSNSGTENCLIYLAYTQADLKENIKAVTSFLPNRALLALVWQAFSQLEEFDLAAAALICRQVLGEKIYPMAIRQLAKEALAVFLELNLVSQKEGVYRLNKPLGKVDLTSSARYRQLASRRKAALQFLLNLQPTSSHPMFA